MRECRIGGPRGTTRMSSLDAGRLAIAVLALAGSLACGAADAALGEGVGTVEADRMQARASVRQVIHATFTVHELNTASQGIVREFVSPAGQVFAVTWHGPAMPNLRQVLGANFDVLANARRRRSGTRGYISLTEGKLVFESSGHMRSFHGRAYLIDALPQGVTTNEIE